MNERIAFVGTGTPPGEGGETEGWGMAHHHATGYERVGGCDLIACADLVESNAAAFARDHGIPDDAVYTDHVELLEAEAPDVVSVCTPPPVHDDIVIDCADAGVDAVHCEKPMAATWGDCRRMAVACDDAGVVLTFDHQRRFGPAVRHAKTLLDRGTIGTLERVTVDAGNLFDWGTHIVDLSGYFADEAEAAWVLAAVDASDAADLFGVPHENQGLAHWRYANGVDGIATTGDGSMTDDLVRLSGSTGTIRIPGALADELPVWASGGTGTITVPEADAYAGALDLVSASVAETMTALRTGREPENGADAALRTMQVLFGAYESVRRRGRVEFPRDIDDHPLATMLEDGTL